MSAEWVFLVIAWNVDTMSPDHSVEVSGDTLAIAVVEMSAWMERADVEQGEDGDVHLLVVAPIERRNGGGPPRARSDAEITARTYLDVPLP